MCAAPEVRHLPRDVADRQSGQVRGFGMPGARETVAGGACPDIRSVTVGNDIGDRRVVAIRKPVRRIPMIVDLFLGALQRAAWHRSERLRVEVEIPLGQRGFVEDRVRPLDIGSGHERGRQRQNCY